MLNRRGKISSYSVLLVLFAVVVTVLYGYRLNFPEVPYYDEVHYVGFMKKILYERVYAETMTSHPPLWNLLTMAAMKLLGDTAVSWRIVSLIAGLLCVGAVYKLTRQITKDNVAALFAAMLFAVDGIAITQARIAMVNSLALLFCLTALWSFLQYFQDFRWPREKSLFWTGVWMGLALCTKLTSISMLLFIFILILVYTYRLNKGEGKLFWQCLVFLGFVPLVLYALTHAFIPFLEGRTVLDIWEINNFYLLYHAKEAGQQTHPYASSWLGWPMMLRPIWFFFENHSQTVNGILSIGNQAVLWTFCLVIFYTIWDFFKNRSWVSGIILLGYFSQWMFFALGSRLKYFHYYYNAMPYVCMALAVILAKLWRTQYIEVGKFFVFVYFLVVFGLFIYWYPLLTGYPVPYDYYYNHMWFPSRWI